MNLTLKAILARFNGDVPKAVAYCNNIADTAASADVRLEYNLLGQIIWRDAVNAEKATAAHA